MHCILKITIALVHYSNKFHPVYREFGFAIVTFTDILITLGVKIVYGDLYSPSSVNISPSLSQTKLKFRVCLMIWQQLIACFRLLLQVCATL